MSLDDEKKSSRNRQEIEDPHVPGDAQMTSSLSSSTEGYRG